MIPAHTRNSKRGAPNLPTMCSQLPAAIKTGLLEIKFLSFLISLEDVPQLCYNFCFVRSLQARIRMLALCTEEQSKEFYATLKQQKDGQAF